MTPLRRAAAALRDAAAALDELEAGGAPAPTAPRRPRARRQATPTYRPKHEVTPEARADVLREHARRGIR